MGTEARIDFINKVAIELADNERVSLWDTVLTGSISLRGESLHIEGYWPIPSIVNFIDGAFLGIRIVHSLLEGTPIVKQRIEDIPVRNIEHIIVDSSMREIAVYHIFQSRDCGASEVHSFYCHADPNPTLHQLNLQRFSDMMRSLVSPDRYKVV
ncbi:MAG: hypothetical protein HZC51_05530 [Nitrospirae bacterium]|nr:hypothetical protein [Nitrospirota bacterium]